MVTAIPSRPARPVQPALVEHAYPHHPGMCPAAHPRCLAAHHAVADVLDHKVRLAAHPAGLETGPNVEQKALHRLLAAQDPEKGVAGKIVLGVGDAALDAARP